MSEKDYVELTFRYRPKAHSFDAMLVEYLNELEPIERKQLILIALRAFYMMPAYAQYNSCDDPVELAQFAQKLKDVYGKADLQDTLRIDITVSYDGYCSLPGYLDEEE